MGCSGARRAAHGCREARRRALGLPGLALAAAALLSLAGWAGAATYGAAKSNEVCRAEAAADRDALLWGGKEPYAWWGPPADCKTPGCTHGYWGRYCRYQFEPHCPSGLRKELGAWLRERAGGGAQWAADALLLQPCDLFPLVRGRNVWVAGDSTSQDIAYVIACFLVEYMVPDAPTPDERGPLPISHSQALMSELEEDVENKRVAYWCKVFEDDTRVCYLNADKADRLQRLLRLLPTLGTSQDVLLLNTGMHYLDMHELRHDVENVAESLDAHRDRLPRHVYWKETTPQHYLTKTGSLDTSTPIPEQRCHPAGKVLGVNFLLQPDGAVQPEVDDNHPVRKDPELQTLLAGGERNVAVRHAVSRVGLKVLPLYNATLMLPQYHKHIHKKGSGGQCVDILCDCTHTCSPSWGQLALGGLWNLLREDLK